VGEYRLDDLGWFQFERLCQALLAAKHGLAVEAWGGAADWGRDAWAPGPLAFPGNEVQPGPFLFQCKFVAGAQQLGRAGALNRLRDSVAAEARRIRERSETGWVPPAHYVLMTNAEIKDTKRSCITEPLERVLPSFTRIHLVPGQDIATLLLTAPSVRLSFPQVLGLRDLEGLLHGVVNRDISTRAHALLAVANDLARVFVPTAAYVEAVSRLEQQRYVVLSGAPENGKTSIARMIVLARAASGCEVVDCSHGPGVFDRAHVESRPQVFLADDAFGLTEYRPDLAREWEDGLARVIRMLGPDQWMIWTSRPAPLRAALQRMTLRDDAERFPDPAEVVVEAAALTNEEKALMVYRHARAIGLSEAAKTLLRKHIHLVLSDRAFTPLRLRSFLRNRLEPLAESGAKRRDVADAIAQEMREPDRGMRASVRALSAPQRDVLFSMLDVPAGAWVSRGDLSAAWARHRSTVSATSLGELADGLSNHFLRTDASLGATAEMFEWVHPSWRDLVITELVGAEQLRRRFLQRAGIDGIMLALSTCGATRDAGALPFLVDRGDWEILRKRAGELGHDGDAGTLRRLMSGFENLMHTQELAPDERSGLALAVANLLAGVRHRWNEADDILETADLARYFSLSEAVRPLPPAPALDTTWASHEPLLDALDRALPRQAVRDVLRFVSVVSDNEPRSVRQHRFPDRWRRQIKAFGESLRAAIRAEDWAPGRADAADVAELARRSERAELNHAIAYAFADLVGQKALEWRQLAEDAYRIFSVADADHHTRVDVPAQSDPDAIEVPSGTVPITPAPDVAVDMLLSDL
jgi:hypothetical protein